MRCRLHLSVLSVILVCAFAGLASSVCNAASPRSQPSEDKAVQTAPSGSLDIPGPLRSFLRMAGISQQAPPDQVLPLLARNIFLTGYHGSGSRQRPTEFLILLRRYVQQAKELTDLAGPGGVIRVAGCPDAGQLLKVLGYRVRGECGLSSTYVETADPDRAFLTIDSGFPLSQLESTLQGRGPFLFRYTETPVPMYLTERDWLDVVQRHDRDKRRGDLLDVLLRDPLLARLYYAWSRMEPETQAALQRKPGLKALLPVAGALDFYGSYIRIRSGRVLVPGGPAADAQWRDLVGASPQSPGRFVVRLAAKDKGWLAAYFDSLSRIAPEQQAHFVQAPRLRRCYEALRGKRSSGSAVGSVFRPDPDLLLLMSRLQWDPDGNLHVPGSLRAWKVILDRKPVVALASHWDLQIPRWTTSEGLLEALFSFSRVEVTGGPADIFLALSNVDRRRPPGRRLSPAIVERMGESFPRFGDQYLIFSEFPQLSDASIALFLNTAESFGRIRNLPLRGNAMGIFEANVGLWEILARQGEIPPGNEDSSWQEVIHPFAHVSSPTQLFDAGRNSFASLLQSAGSLSANFQDAMIDLLAGPKQKTADGQQIHNELADRIRGALDDQRLVSLDTLMSLDDGLIALAQGDPPRAGLVSLADQLSEFQMPRPIFTNSERIAFTAGAYNNRHTETEMHTNLKKVLASPSSTAEVEEARGELVPFLRDTLVGLNYAYYEPPDAQALHNNFLLVRSHDFAGETVIGVEGALWQTPRLFGAGNAAGVGAHLVGSLAELPYVLARLEDNFISPQNVQALIWSDLVPSLLTDAVVPRWWGVTRNELHAVALYQRAGEELLAASVKDQQLRAKVEGILARRMTPRRLARIDEALRSGQLGDTSSEITPADKFYLTAEVQRRYPDASNVWGPAGRELSTLLREDPADLSWNRLSRDFGIPHPVLGWTYERSLMNMGPFPLFEGYSSELLAETWDSTNLYWARLADEMGYPPEALNELVPELTVRMVANISASEPNDWPAILRAMRKTAMDFRQRQRASPRASRGDP